MKINPMNLTIETSNGVKKVYKNKSEFALGVQWAKALNPRQFNVSMPYEAHKKACQYFGYVVK
jgi:hypothetical protein